MPPKRFDPDEALARACDAFWAKGYEGTSAQDLVDAMGINRGSLYATFGNKRRLYELALDLYLERDRATLAKTLDGEPPLRAILAQLLGRYADQLAADPERRGCFFANACAELSPDDAPLAARLTAELDAQRGLFEDAFRAARDRGEPLASRDEVQLAGFVVGALQGMRLVGKVTGDRDRLESIITLTLDAISGPGFQT
ncbi:MAG: TetR/AcrR family transcriptional regulator [Thermoleophilia bacterium]